VTTIFFQLESTDGVEKIEIDKVELTKQKCMKFDWGKFPKLMILKELKAFLLLAIRYVHRDILLETTS
jgi:hypothetical protein